MFTLLCEPPWSVSVLAYAEGPYPDAACRHLRLLLHLQERPLLRESAMAEFQQTWDDLKHLGMFCTGL